MSISAVNRTALKLNEPFSNNNLEDDSEYNLLEHQIAHFDRIVSILQRHPYAVDTSEMGSGKTYVGCMLAKRLGLKLFVVAPVSVLSVWEKVANLAKVELVKPTRNVKPGLISYESLRGLRGYRLHHPYLTRNEYDDGSIDYQGTKILDIAANEGMLLVFDEFQNIKNVTMAQAASRGLVDGIKNTRSRSLFLSATPFDKSVQFFHFLNTLGVISEPEPTDEDRTKIIDTMKSINPELTEDIIDPTKEQIEVKKKVERVKIPIGDVFPAKYYTGSSPVFYNLFAFVFVPELFSAMDPPAIGVEKIVRNGFYNILDEDDYYELTDAIRLFSKIAWQYALALEKGDYEKAEILFSIMMSAIVSMERAKISTLIRLGEEVLINDPNCKVIFSCFYKESHTRLQEYFMKA